MSGPNPTQWLAIQALADDDCPMSIIAQLAEKKISMEEAADRIEAYAAAAFELGKVVR